MYFEDFDLARRISEISKVVYYPQEVSFTKVIVSIKILNYFIICYVLLFLF